MKRKLPKRITFQWHITEKCNFRCLHCYQNNFQYEGVSLDEQTLFLDNIHRFVLSSKKVNGVVRAHINFTGGEPFIRKEFLQLLRKVKEKNIFSFGVLSNGFTLPLEKLNEFKSLGPSFVQISLEGDKEINDEIRGTGSYDSIVSALKIYSKLRIPTIISFTANSRNYVYFPDVVKIARKYQVKKVWTDRYIPSSNEDQLSLNTLQAKHLFQLVLREQNRSKFHFFSKTLVSSSRALQFLISGGSPYKCSAAESLLAFLPNGDILPCRRLPIKMGNLKKDNLEELYLNNDLAEKIHSTSEGCSNCYYRGSCNGGLKCLSYAKLNDFNRKDPNCWI